MRLAFLLRALLTSSLRAKQAKGESGPKIQELAVACLSDYAESSVVNCGKIAVVGGGAELGRIAAAAVQEGRRHSLETQLTRMMGILARDCPIRSSLALTQLSQLQLHPYQSWLL